MLAIATDSDGVERTRARETGLETGLAVYSRSGLNTNAGLAGGWEVGLIGPPNPRRAAASWSRARICAPLAAPTLIRLGTWKQMLPTVA